MKLNKGACRCPHRAAGLCVTALDIPPLGKWYIHHDGRAGEVARRATKHHPTTDAVTRTAVQFRVFDQNGREKFWHLACAGPSSPDTPVRAGYPGG
ncbi:hypothetical protein [Streptomyces sp. MJM8645]|uniref:hypothetical protein n=1 Tax=Streptomycetaceae TaxID=2062 RepID=UPI000A433837|nr:hypothetical protein [Streptomyces sp. MJM8645]